MEFTFDRFTSQVEAAIHSTCRVETTLIDVQIPKQNVPADLCFPTFRAAKQLGINPPDLAQELADAITIAPDSLIGDVSVAGPYLNFTFHRQRFATAVLQEIVQHSTAYGHDDMHQGKTMVIDYSSPNVAKRMHVGHIRSTIIGQALVHIFGALGYRVISDNHLGDWGKQFGVIIAAIQRYGKPQAEGEEALSQLEAIYARYNDDMQHDETMDEEARAWSLRLEQGNEEARALWKWCVETTLVANQLNYERLGIHFDHIYGESFYEGMLQQEISQALAQGVARRDEGGAVVVDELENKLPSFLLQRSDGGTLYITRDVATIAFRVREFNPDSIVYVVGAPQELHFRQLFALTRVMGYTHNIELVHVPFGTISDASGQTLSTRRGNMIYLQALLDEAVTRAYHIIDEKNPDLPAQEKTHIAEIVGIGAVVYNDLYQDTRRNITLDWDRMLSIEGNSATYLQYTYARCRSILRKANIIDIPQTLPEHIALLEHPAEQHLIKHLAQLPSALREAGKRFAPFVIAEWCYTTSRAFGIFFEQCPVLKAESPALHDARLLLVYATAQALHNGLSLLGIKAPERM